MRPPSYKVNEIFYSLQGEGAHAGRAAVFVRLSGCSMGCEFCDTKYSSAVNFELGVEEILAEIAKYSARLAVITGGEPCEQDIAPLFAALKNAGYEAHLETNGSIDADVSAAAHVTVSPKKHVSESMLLKAHVIKLVAAPGADIEKYFKYAAPQRTIYLQPESNKKENIALCVNLIKKHPFLRLSVQLHKMINIP